MGWLRRVFSRKPASLDDRLMDERNRAEQLATLHASIAHPDEFGKTSRLTKFKGPWEKGVTDTTTTDWAGD
jgi:hypothetical protein